VRAVLRRTRGEMGAATELLTVRDLKLDVGRHTVALDGEPIELTPSEFEILRAMLNAPGRVFSRLQLLEAAQGQAYEGYERTVDTHVKNLRRKIEPDPPNPIYIMTVHGLGYKLREE
jgi:DNA-binding response OmpR family regulator